ncbi:MAG: molybdenum cofactor guanylyltransferase [Planctomycetales bacterium]|nr:molybdenum cofactor guanylyltransferase [Planctomycetales bacterium]
MPVANCPAYILAGGKSSRFGGDKALVEIQGQPQLQRLARQLNNGGHRVHLVCNGHSRHDQLQCVVPWLDLMPIIDKEDSAGPVSGLAAALEHRLNQLGQGWILLVACDQLRWESNWYVQLSETISAHHVAAVFRERDGSAFHPLPGMYHTLLLDHVKTCLASGRRSLRGLLDNAACHCVQADCPPGSWSFNTREELQQLLIDNRYDAQ